MSTPLLPTTIPSFSYNRKGRQTGKPPKGKSDVDIEISTLIRTARKKHTYFLQSSTRITSIVYLLSPFRCSSPAPPRTPLNRPRQHRTCKIKCFAVAVLYDVHCAWEQDRASTLRPLFRGPCSHTGALAVPVSIRVTRTLFLAGLSAVYVHADWQEGALTNWMGPGHCSPFSARSAHTQWR